MFLSEVHNLEAYDYLSIYNHYSAGNEIRVECIFSDESIIVKIPELLDYEWWEGGYCIHVADLEPKMGCDDCEGCEWEKQHGMDCTNETSFCPCNETEKEYEERNMENKIAEHGSCRQCADNAYEYAFKDWLWLVLEDNFGNLIRGV